MEQQARPVLMGHTEKEWEFAWGGWATRILLAIVDSATRTSNLLVEKLKQALNMPPAEQQSDRSTMARGGEAGEEEEFCKGGWWWSGEAVASTMQREF